jgi:hypothetical protein
MKKLSINRETLRNLTAEDLRHVVGGYPPFQIPASDDGNCGGGGGGGGGVGTANTCDSCVNTCGTCYNTCAKSCVGTCVYC